MSLTRPTGEPVTIGGREFHLLFTLSAVDAIESEYGIPLADVIAKLTDPRQVYATEIDLLHALINDELQYDNARTGKNEPEITKQEIGWCVPVTDTREITRAIGAAYGLSFPDNDDEDDDPNATSRENA